MINYILISIIKFCLTVFITIYFNLYLSMVLIHECFLNKHSIKHLVLILVVWDIWGISIGFISQINAGISYCISDRCWFSEEVLYMIDCTHMMAILGVQRAGIDSPVCGKASLKSYIVVTGKYVYLFYYMLGTKM